MIMTLGYKYTQLAKLAAIKKPASPPGMDRYYIHISDNGIYRNGAEPSFCAFLIGMMI